MHAMEFWKQDLGPRVWALQHFLTDQRSLKHGLASNIADAQRIQSYHASEGYATNPPLARIYGSTPCPPIIAEAAERVRQCATEHDLAQLFPTRAERDAAFSTIVAIMGDPRFNASTTPGGPSSSATNPNQISLPGNSRGRGGATGKPKQNQGINPSIGALCASVIGKEAAAAPTQRTKRRKRKAVPSITPNKKAKATRPNTGGTRKKKKKARKGTPKSRLSKLIKFKTQKRPHLPPDLQRSTNAQPASDANVQPAPDHTDMDIDEDNMFADLSD